MQEEKKRKCAFWLSPETKQCVEDKYQSANCKSQSEYVEKALLFYEGYLSASNATEFLAPVIAQTIKGTLDGFCAHISRNLFRLAVEEAKTWNLIAGLFQVSPEKLKHIHNKATGEVKRLKGKLNYEYVFENPPEVDGIDITEDDD